MIGIDNQLNQDEINEAKEIRRQEEMRDEIQTALLTDGSVAVDVFEFLDQAALALCLARNDRIGCQEIWDKAEKAYIDSEVDKQC